MEEGQLYTIHGLYRGGFEVLLLFAVTWHKSEENYLTMFGKMKEAVQAAVGQTVAKYRARAKDCRRF
ncbi:hypothetical protein ANCCAN_12366 [Ancylostoma caninum]|uniref:Uncharacterized protein n=1 Tax=Ancylostoma caninum TaxID=29170 RepID=A0A368GBB4_ANCCA|nr:hypothetical protein ANCCAN_12366 [Ancylostoma caninum]